MITPLPATTPVQTRARCNHRDTASRASITTATCNTVSASKQTVGGAMFETRSPGSPTMLCGYGTERREQHQCGER